RTDHGRAPGRRTRSARHGGLTRPAAARRLRGRRTVYWRRKVTLEISLIDGTYELFRHFYAVPSVKDRDGREVGAVRGVLASVLGMIESGTQYVGVATDHVI